MGASFILLYFLLSSKSQTKEEYDKEIKERWSKHIEYIKSLTVKEKRRYYRKLSIQVYSFFIILGSAIVSMIISLIYSLI